MQIIFISIKINCSSQITRKIIRVARPPQSRVTTNYRWDHNIWLHGPLLYFLYGKREGNRKVNLKENHIKVEICHNRLKE